MTNTLKLRLAIFILAIGSAVFLVVWAAHDSWKQSDLLRKRLTTVQLESFHIADHFQQTIQELNNLLLRLAINRQPANREQFETKRKELDEWIDLQRKRPKLSVQEQARLRDIDVAYDFYMAAGTNIAARVTATGPPTSLADFSDLATESERLLSLGFKLAEAHRESLDEFLNNTNKSLARLQVLLLLSLLCLLLLFIGMAVITFREMIAPLQLRLIESQALIERNEKLASLGMLAAGVAHEIRNPLTAIKARLFTLQKRLERETSNYNDSEVIAQEINRLERIVKDVLLFARPGDPQFAVVNAEQPLREAETLLRPQLERAKIELVVEESRAGQVRVDAQQIKQVLINLVQNAAESIGQNGTIRLRARNESKRLGGERIEAVVLEVADSGKGIPAEVQKRLFDPFFSTKDTGTGLGLAIASRIVEKHGGALQYQTEVNHGTTFGIVLPRA
jgi:signal transduction histidine kinase